jgi:predicted amidohydrolase YtcJ
MMKLLAPLLLALSLYAQNHYITNARIPSHPDADTLSVVDGVIDCIGTIAECAQPDAVNLIDAKEHVLYPGFIDSHTHIAYAALLSYSGLDLSAVKGKESILEAIGTYAKAHPDLPYIFGFGVYPYVMGRYGPDKSQLDAVESARPVVILSQNGHAAWFNSKALQMAGLSPSSIDNETHRYHFIEDDHGELTGFIIEGEGFFPHLRTFGIGDQKTFEAAFRHFLPTLARHGITTIYDAGIAGLEDEAYGALVALDRNDALPVRYVGSHILISRDDDASLVDDFKRLDTAYRSELFHVGSVKVMLDGKDNEDGHFIHYSPDELANTLAGALEHDIDIMVHTTIDESTHLTLDALEQARRRHPASNSRVALAHINMVRDEDFDRFARLGAIANIQPFNAKHGGFLEYLYVEYEEAWEHKLARHRTFADHGVVISASSDYPACNGPLESCAPLASIETAVTRKKPGAPLHDPGLDSMDEALSVDQALQAYTVGGAYQLNRESEIGTIAVGKKADIILLEEALENVPVNAIGSINVKLTMVNGRVVFKEAL